MRVEARPATALGFIPCCHSTTPWPSTSMPRRPARPVSWVYSPGVMSAWVSPFHFESFSMTTERAGMLMPRASVSVAKTDPAQPPQEQLLDALLERRQHAGVVGGDAAGQAVEEVVVAEDLQVLVGQVGAALLDEGEDLVALLGRGQPDPERRHCCTAASQPTRLKMNTIAGSRPAAVELLDDVDPARDPHPTPVADRPAASAALRALARANGGRAGACWRSRRARPGAARR